MTARDPHAGQPVRSGWREPRGARVGALLLHGRGGSAEDILGLADQFSLSAFAYLAPQAAGHSWYPLSFLAPPAQNEPYLSSALEAVGRALAQFEAAGIPPARVMLGGFSQGACLALEVAARAGQRLGGVFAFSGALITLEHAGDLAGTPVFMGVDERDGHIPLDRFQQSAEVLRARGARVDARVYRGLGHTINTEEINTVRDTMRQLIFDSLEDPK